MRVSSRLPVRSERPLEAPGRRPSPDRPFGDVRFVPARWLVVALAIVRLLLVGGPFRKLQLAGLVWSVTPRTPRRLILGLALGWLIVVVGALAAIVLLAIQIA